MQQFLNLRQNFTLNKICTNHKHKKPHSNPQHQLLSLKLSLTSSFFLAKSTRQSWMLTNCRRWINSARKHLACNCTIFSNPGESAVISIFGRKVPANTKKWSLVAGDKKLAVRNGQGILEFFFAIICKSLNVMDFCKCPVLWYQIYQEAW
jgi:hypothetical protein